MLFVESFFLDMFSTIGSLKRRTGRFGVGRFAYLKQLFDEYQHPSTNDQNKLQILANFSNFCYDPINFEHIRRLNIIDLLIDCLKTHVDDDFVDFSLAGLCNLSADPMNTQIILDKCPTILFSLVRCLFSTHLNLVMNSILTMMFLSDKQKSFHEEIKKHDQIRITIEQLSKSKDKRLSNVSSVFLNDYFQ